MYINHENVCTCGEYKSADALLCYDCNKLLEQVRADLKPRSEKHTCPECGGYKSVNGKVCQECALPAKRVNARRASAISAERKRGQGGHRLVCPECGGVKEYRSNRCSVCATRHRKRIQQQTKERVERAVLRDNS